MQPRAAVVYMTIGALECAAACGAAPSLRGEIEGAQAVLEEISTTHGGDDIARALQDSIPAIHGAGATAAVARRWKTQINENAKLPCFFSEVPEANHNEIEGWSRGLDLVPLSSIFLHAPGLHPRLERRMELTEERLADLGMSVLRVDAPGDSPVAHILALVMIGDLVSVSLAELAGVDPTPVEAIEGFKSALG
jgi:glucose/mannose-6-phosphate isomerase